MKNDNPRLYRSPFEAYPFLCDDSENLCCDFELLTDEIASRTGLLRAQVKDEGLRSELLWVCELIYHINPTLRTRLTVTEEETLKLKDVVERLRQECGDRCRQFVLTQGCEAACTAHVLRVQCKNLVRLMYRHSQQGKTVPKRLFDLGNLLSDYFFHLALKLNKLEGVEEIAFVSRNYS